MLRLMIQDLIHIHIYIHMHSTTRIPLTLVYEVYIRSNTKKYQNTRGYGNIVYVMSCKIWMINSPDPLADPKSRSTP